MNKTDLIEHIARQADISKASAARALDSVIDGITASLVQGESVSLVGFGSFSVTRRAARAGRNPRTGAVIRIGATSMPRFRPGKALRDALV
ncbi:nucleoid protein Hbs [Sphaerotilus hippei]|uniref:Nucleoid protein Hbs n=1 Tax=Sphaerotilus hippei TaxID=744406 RepID=A0A318GYP6_9BURK|nr:nucleoid protein Hbs [Sphaerotilus hippei]